jgi:hypothetical protein|tara:strand:- start:2849 stop:3055 length:207 start_codon:yes stop_codon:yes gene_type:complete
MSKNKFGTSPHEKYPNNKTIKVAPKVIDRGGITELKGVGKFRDTMEFANEKFPRSLGGGLGPLLGEDN